jgi:hypothetical protein
VGPGCPASRPRSPRRTAGLPSPSRGPPRRGRVADRGRATSRSAWEPRRAGRQGPSTATPHPPAGWARPSCRRTSGSRTDRSPCGGPLCAASPRGGQPRGDSPRGGPPGDRSRPVARGGVPAPPAGTWTAREGPPWPSAGRMPGAEATGHAVGRTARSGHRAAATPRSAGTPEGPTPSDGIPDQASFDVGQASSDPETASTGWSGSRRPGGAPRRRRRSTPTARAPPSSAVRAIHPDRRSLLEPAYVRGLFDRWTPERRARAAPSDVPRPEADRRPGTPALAPSEPNGGVPAPPAPARASQLTCEGAAADLLGAPCCGEAARRVDPGVRARATGKGALVRAIIGAPSPTSAGLPRRFTESAAVSCRWRSVIDVLTSRADGCGMTNPLQQSAGKRDVSFQPLD